MARSIARYRVGYMVKKPNGQTGSIVRINDHGGDVTYIVKDHLYDSLSEYLETELEFLSSYWNEDVLYFGRS